MPTFWHESVFHTHRTLLRAALALGNLFAWIFVFEYLYGVSGKSVNALVAVALLYALAQLITFVATPIAAAHLRRGTKQSLIWGLVFCGAAFVVLGTTLSGDFFASPLWGLATFAVLLGIYRALYFIPYRLTASQEQPHLHVRAYLEGLVALLPLFAGLTIAGLADSPLRLLYGAAALAMLSIVPALFLPTLRERFSWSFTYTIAQLFRRKNHGLVLHALLDGVQGAALFLVWPLAIFLIVEGSYLTFGFICTLTLLFLLLARRFSGGVQKRLALKDNSPVYVVVAVTAWVARLAAGSTIGIVIADLYAYGTQPRRSSADPFTFEQSADRGAFLDEYTALKEMGLAVGRMKVCALILMLAFVLPLPFVLAVVLAVAGVASALHMVLARYIHVGTY